MHILIPNNLKVKFQCGWPYQYHTSNGKLCMAIFVLSHHVGVTSKIWMYQLYINIGHKPKKYFWIYGPSGYLKYKQYMSQSIFKNIAQITLIYDMPFTAILPKTLF